MTVTEQRQQIVRGCIILFVLIICCFLWLSILSFDIVDSPSPYVFPHPQVSQNAGGLAGAFIAYRLFSYFGLGAYAAAGGLSLILGVALWKGKLTSLWQRIVGLLLIIAVVSTIGHIITSSAPGNWIELRGGVLGYFIAGWLLPSFKYATWPILIYGLFVGLLFAAEELILQIPAQFANHKEELRESAGGAARMFAGPFVLLYGLLHRPKNAKPARVPRSTANKRKAQPPSLTNRVLTWFKTHATMPSLPLKRTAVAEPAAKRKVKPPVDEQIEEEVEDVVEPGADDEDEWEYVYEDEDEAADEADGEEEYEYEEEDEVEAEEDDDLDEEPLAPEPQMVINFAKPPIPSAETTVKPVRPYPAELSEWEFPSIELLHEPEYNFSEQQEEIVREKARDLEQALQEFKVEANVVAIDTGPVITMFELSVAPGVKVSQINSLSNDIARSLRAPSVRVVAPIPGKNTIGIEVPNVDKEKVRIKELMTVAGPQIEKMALPLFLGKDASGTPLIGDLAKMPHMLIAGTTGSGKSVCINSIIISLLLTQRPDMVKLILVDPKMVEMSMFREVPHLMCPIVTEMERAEKILEWATIKMDERYALLAEAGVRNIAAYNRMSMEEKLERFQPSNEDEKAQIPLHLPYMVIIIDELADLMMMSAKEVELHLSRLAQKSRAVGVHIIVATQRPEAKVVTGLIKSNLPCRVAFRVASRMDSRIVLDQNGAEVLMGQGDMLYLPPGSSKLVRAQGTYLEDSELKDIINFLKERGEPEFHPELMRIGKQDISSDGPRDELFDKAVEIVLETRRGSVSLLQRRLTIGYSRASRLIEEMAAAGIVGQYKGSQAREVAITREQWEALKQQEVEQMTADAQRVRNSAFTDPVDDDIFDDDI